MATSFQNLRAITTGVEPTSLLPGQIAFNLVDKVMYVGDGTDTKKTFDGITTPGTAEGGWYSLPLDFSSLGGFFIQNPLYYGDSPSDEQILTWNENAGHPVWSTGGSGGIANQVYATTDASVAAAPGATVSDKISAAIVVSFPEEGDVTVVAGVFGDTYEGTYFWTGSEWIKGGPYAPTPVGDYTTAGVVRLADAVETEAGLSETSAITPKALQDIVTDNVTSSNDHLIASSVAVSTAYDKGVEALSVAEAGGATSATTLYVSTEGDDATAQRGTNRPFATLTAALAAAQQADTIFMSAGNFTEDVTLTKGVNLVGTFRDQNAQAGTTITGNFVLDLTNTSSTSLTSIAQIRFKSPNANPAFYVSNNSSAAGGITTITDCFFSQQSSSSLTEFCFETAGTWTRSLYLRRPDFDGNVQHAAGDLVGTNGYLVLDYIEGTGSPTRHYEVRSGTVEFRRPSNSLSPILHTGGVVQIVDAVNGISPTDTNTAALFGSTGICYKGTNDGGLAVVAFTGNNIFEGIVNIGANVIYTWNNLAVVTANLMVDPAAVYLPDADPTYANGLELSSSRPRIGTMVAPTTTLTPADVAGQLVIDTLGSFHTVTSSLVFVAAPSTSTDPGSSGDVAIDVNYLYVHNGTAWTRIALDTTPW